MWWPGTFTVKISWKGRTFYVLWISIFVGSPTPRVIFYFFLRTSATVSCLEALILEFHNLYLDSSSGEGAYVLPSYQQTRKKINRAIQSVSLEQISYFEPLLTQWMFTSCPPLWHYIVPGNIINIEIIYTKVRFALELLICLNSRILLLIFLCFQRFIFIITNTDETITFRVEYHFCKIK